MNYLPILLVLLLTAPAMAQVVPSPFGGNAGGGGGGGGGTVTSVATTSPITGGTITTSGTIACATCLSTGNFFNSATLSGVTNNLILSINGSGNVFQGTPAGTGSAGSIGYNGHGNVEVIADGSALGAGVFAGSGLNFVIHDSSNENNSQFGMYNDVDGIANAFVMSVYGAYPDNALGMCFGNGAGGATCSHPQLNLSPAATTINSGNVLTGDTAVTDSGTNNVILNISGAHFGSTGFSNTFLVTQGQNTGDLVILSSKNSTTQIQQANSTGTAQMTVATVMTDTLGVGSVNAAQGLVTSDAGDATGNVLTHVLSPQIVRIGALAISAGHGAWVLDNSLSAGSKPYWALAVDSTHAVAFIAPSTSSPAFEVFTLPPAYPAANGQPLVSTTAGVMSFAAGKTQAYVLCTGAACATSCTLTFTGGILTANSGTCP